MKLKNQEKRVASVMTFHPAALPVARMSLILWGLLTLAIMAATNAGDVQQPIARVQVMARTPEPLVVRDWPQVARQYPRGKMDPRAKRCGGPPEQLALSAAHNDYDL
jgi:hypothetical protein